MKIRILFVFALLVAGCSKSQVAPSPVGAPPPPQAAPAPASQQSDQTSQPSENSEQAQAAAQLTSLSAVLEASARAEEAERLHGTPCPHSRPNGRCVSEEEWEFESRGLTPSEQEILAFADRVGVQYYLCGSGDNAPGGFCEEKRAQEESEAGTPSATQIIGSLTIDDVTDRCGKPDSSKIGLESFLTYSNAFNTGPVVGRKFSTVDLFFNSSAHIDEGEVDGIPYGSHHSVPISEAELPKVMPCLLTGGVAK